MPHFRTSSNDSLIVHPPGFYIIGFETFPFITVYFIFLAFVYAITLLFNCLVIYIITITTCLHTPKFVAVVNLAVIDIILNSCTIPSMIRTFLLKDNFVPFGVCLLQMFIYYSFAALESYALAVLAYDRLIAICFPLKQNSINTLWSMSTIVAVTWSVALGATGFATIIMTRLSFCKSVRVLSYFCDYAPVFRLACNDNRLQWTMASTLSMVALILPFTFIILSYVSILVTIFNMESVGSRIKALATCTEHLILVAIYYTPIFSIFSIGLFVRSLDPDHRVLCLSLASCIPPCINPILYSLKTKDIKIRVLALLRKKRVGKIPVLPKNW